MAELKSKLKTDVKVTTRLRVLYLFVYEMAEAFGADKSALECIYKGVYEKKILKTIIFDYHNSAGVIVGRVSIDIDWDKHQLLAKSDDGNSFRIDSSKNVRDQISDLSDTIIRHVNQLRKQYKVTKVSSKYVYIPEISFEREENEKAMKFLGHSYGKSDTSNIDPEFAKRLSWCIDRLSEVTIYIDNN